ncbi:hypothetical protein ECH_1094 [Ehrlichia chaffeensis str. Arkansas]|uniref:Uncharacterized protein n=1 Tax=Ehrlichia chaffeensis (strain ATCC CRL-10679 / Arkansas) TaxID=205920 RepID=Q2GFA4_EHRCR|nr:hypothetical protein ECH_1094 [Ehrlichia chaffeensis str. Arkansas]
MVPNVINYIVNSLVHKDVFGHIVLDNIIAC